MTQTTLGTCRGNWELDSNTSPTVSLYLELFNLDSNLLYRDYFENFKLLIEWLGLPSPTVVETYKPVPSVLRTYEIQEISKLLKTDQYAVWLEAMKLASKKAGI